jgi:hypothetical protein
MNMPKKKRPASCSAKLARIRAVLKSRTPGTLAIAEIEHLVGLRKKPHWR